MRAGTRFASMLLLMASSGAFAATDPLRSPECEAATASLQAAEQAAPKASPGSAPPPALQSARRAAARACLGTRLDEDRPPQAPQVVAPITVPLARGGIAPDASRAARAPATPALPPIAPSTRPPPTVTTCDAGGCWATDGTRLDRVGPGLLVGPRGGCIQNGAMLSCP